MLAISSLLVGSKNIEIPLSFVGCLYLCEYFMFFLCSFSYRSKVIIIGVSNIMPSEHFDILTMLE